MNHQECPIAAWARVQPRAIAVEMPSERITFAELDDHVGRMTSLLRDQGIAPGQLVAFLGDNRYANVVLLGALWRLPAIAFPISPRTPPLARRKQLDSFQVSAAFDDTDAELASALRQPPDKRTLHVWDLEAPATVVMTSGSTMAPRGVVHTLAAHGASARGSAANIPLRPGHHWLWSLPVWHISGLALVMRTLLAGATLVAADSKAPSDAAAWDAVTHLSLVATQLRRLLADPQWRPRRLEAVLLGGGPCPVNVLEAALDRGVPLHTTYGLTEMASQVTATPANANLSVLLTAGQLLPERELRIAANGEIHVRGSTLCLGYRQGGSHVLAVDESGWFPTRDQGSMDEDRLTVLGRLDNMFVCGGENIHPEEIEAHFLALPPVQQVIVVPVEDLEFGKRPVAFVAADEYDIPGWERFLRERIPGYKVPVAIYPWPESSPPALKPSRTYFENLARTIRSPS